VKNKGPKKKSEPPASDKRDDQALRDSIERSAKLANMALALDSFPTFASQAEVEAYSDKTGDAYFEICYHLEGKLNLCLKAMHDLYPDAPSSKRPKMQTGLAREIICPEGWPKHPKTLVATPPIGIMACRMLFYAGLMHAGSKGAFYNRHIRGRYR